MADLPGKPPGRRPGRAGLGAQRRQPVLRARADPAAAGPRCRPTCPAPARGGRRDGTAPAGPAAHRLRSAARVGGRRRPRDRPRPVGRLSSDPTLRPSLDRLAAAASAGVVRGCGDAALHPRPLPRGAARRHVRGDAGPRPPGRRVASCAARGRPGTAGQVAAHLAAAGPRCASRGGRGLRRWPPTRRPSGSATTTPAATWSGPWPCSATTSRAGPAPAGPRGGRGPRRPARPGASEPIARSPGWPARVDDAALLARAALGLQALGARSGAQVAEVIALLEDADATARDERRARCRCARRCWPPSPGRNGTAWPGCATWSPSPSVRWRWPGAAEDPAALATCPPRPARRAVGAGERGGPARRGLGHAGRGLGGR